ncbi:MAG: alpha/beta hydrolase [Gammaproteobacteria bacterium]|nr:alpha/beta hydrolase [Gammaproteobacteria bacterium]
MDEFFNLLKKRTPNFIADFLLDSAESFSYKEEADGRPVLVIPGFLTNDHATLLLRSALLSCGFKPYTWNQGTNIIASDSLINTIHKELVRIYDEHKTPVTIIGWSMGGFYARCLAKMSPELVNSVITLGTPFKQKIDIEEMRKKYTKIGIDIDDHPICDQYTNYMGEIPVVPFSSLYSKADIIAPYQDCLETETDISENIEVDTTHFGFVYDPESLRIILNRCLEHKNTWSKFKL